MSELSRWTRSRKQQKKFHKRIMENNRVLEIAKNILGTEEIKLAPNKL